MAAPWTVGVHAVGSPAVAAHLGFATLRQPERPAPGRVRAHSLNHPSTCFSRSANKWEQASRAAPAKQWPAHSPPTTVQAWHGDPSSSTSSTGSQNLLEHHQSGGAHASVVVVSICMAGAAEALLGHGVPEPAWAAATSEGPLGGAVAASAGSLLLLQRPLLLAQALGLSIQPGLPPPPALPSHALLLLLLLPLVALPPRLPDPPLPVLQPRLLPALHPGGCNQCCMGAPLDVSNGQLRGRGGRAFAPLPSIVDARQ